MNPHAKLSPRESEVTELIAWGAALKEAATILNITYKTADNHLQNIKHKIGCNKTSEISVWWFCTNYGISFELSPMRKSIVSLFFICILAFGEFMHTSEICKYRVRRIRKSNIEQLTRTRIRTYELYN